VGVSAFKSFAFLIAVLFLSFALPGDTRATTISLAETFEEKLRLPFEEDFDGIKKREVLRVLVPFSKTFYFIDNGVQRGVAVDMMTEFGKVLDKKYGKELKDGHIVFLPTPRAQLFEALARGEGDIALGNLTVTDERLKLVDFSDPIFDDAREIAVTAAGHDPLESPEDLSGRTVHVRHSSSYYESLVALNARLEAEGKPPVELVPADEALEDEDLLDLVRAGAIPIIIVDDHKAEFWAAVMDGLALHKGAAVREGGHIGVAVRKSAPGLLAEVNGFVKKVKKGTLLGNIILKKYLKETKYLKKLDDPKRTEKFLEVLSLFQKYGAQYDFDWLLIAAQSYQESQFRQDVKSHAGAVGLMQIKPSTAADRNVGIKGVVRDPDKNVHAGVKYMRFLADTYFEDLKADPFNQTLFALAAYNAGPSRFKRLRKAAADQGYDPDTWFNNVEWVVLSKISREPVRYVGNIYKYYVVFGREYQRVLAERERKGE